MVETYHFNSSVLRSFINQICLKICLVLSAEASLKNTDKIIKQKLRNILFKVILNQLLE